MATPIAGGQIVTGDVKREVDVTEEKIEDAIKCDELDISKYLALDDPTRRLF